MISELVKDEYTFGRGDSCDYCFNEQGGGKKKAQYLALSKNHFKIFRVN